MCRDPSCMALKRNSPEAYVIGAAVCGETKFGNLALSPIHVSFEYMYV